ncbi:MAG TPA: AAA family ATPase [Opitutaceae bacterium]|nr:AAA family ATPase [Opitutaceae bacterium]
MLDLAQLESFLNARLLGQREAIAEFVSAILRAEGGPPRPGRTRAFVLLLGPTGTGKTEMVNLTARFLYGTEAAARLERFDMGEYQHPDSVKRLLGAPDQPPLLGRAIERLNTRGGGILLLDEIEKAFPDLLTALLSFDSARSTMFDGTTHDLSRLVVVLTSNLGAAEAARMENSGYSAITRKLRHAAEERFRKEGVARFTAVCCLTVLTYPVQEQITRNALASELKLQSVHLRRLVLAAPEVVTFLVGKGFSPDLGARNIRNCVERHVGEALRAHTFGPASAASALPEAAVSIGDRWSEALVLRVHADALTAGPVERTVPLRAALENAEPEHPASPPAGAMTGGRDAFLSVST